MIDAKTLMGQIENTAPFVFHQAGGVSDVLKPLNLKIQNGETLSALEYFRLTLAAHFSTVGTFVPTDVDLWIREKAWGKVHHERDWLKYFESIQEFSTWSEAGVSRRGVDFGKKHYLSGHQGEALTIMMGAYLSALRLKLDAVQEVREWIEASVQNQIAAVLEHRRVFFSEPNTLNLVKFCSAIAAIVHNLGDLDRCFSRGIEQGRVNENDVLYRRVYRMHPTGNHGME